MPWKNRMLHSDTEIFPSSMQIKIKMCSYFFSLPPHVESCNKRNERKKSCLQPFRKEKEEFNEEVKHQYLPLYKMNIEKQLQFHLGLTKVVWILLEIQLEFLP